MLAALNPSAQVCLLVRWHWCGTAKLLRYVKVIHIAQANAPARVVESVIRAPPSDVLKIDGSLEISITSITSLKV